MRKRTWCADPSRRQFAKHLVPVEVVPRRDWSGGQLMFSPRPRWRGIVCYGPQFGVRWQSRRVGRTIRTPVPPAVAFQESSPRLCGGRRSRFRSSSTRPGR